MNNIPTEQLITLSGENFYELVREQYGEKVEKILRFHDIDDYVLLHRITEQQLFEIFEKPNNENDLRELIDLKKEVCNIYEGKTVLKIGTKNKIIALLKSSRDIVKKNKRQLTSKAKLDRLNNYLSSSSSIDSDLTDAGADMKKYALPIENSIEKILANMQYNVHGDTSTRVTANDFEVIIEMKDGHPLPSCYVQCVCGDRIKLFFNYNRFQLSNFIKHLRNSNDRSKGLMESTNQESNDQTDLLNVNPMNIDEQSSGNENDISPSRLSSNKNRSNNSDGLNNSASVRIKKS